ncbi:DUF4221 family protein [Fluviicola sp.]|uniref:DUF4221 family protein n=1 Tax=Fluviicola sp. TaxID=1917219 RepID=UPI002829B68A|nr:DUF4221 family protein [Fluviicola sp.]MDR0801652.1 hypothetical protein [Fluviicola sp.]
MKNRFFIPGFMLFIAAACTSPAGKTLRETNQELVFDIGFPTGRKEQFTDHNKTYIAFSDLVTRQKIRVFDETGLPVSDFDLNQIATEKQTSFEGFALINKQTVALLEKYRNIIDLVDANGTLLHTKDYSSYLLDGIEMRIPILLQKNRLITSIDYRGTNNPDRWTLQTLTGYYSKRHHSPCIFIDQSFTDSTQHVLLKGEKLYPRFTKEGEMAIGMTGFCFAKKKQLFFFSTHTDSVYTFDSDMEIKTAIRIRSDYFPINLRPTSLAKEMKNGNLHNEETKEKSCIADLKYDEYKQLFYCLIKGPKVGDNPSPTSFIILDKNLHKLSEVKIDNSKYWSFSSFVTKVGLYIENINKDLNSKKYTLFKYE